MLGVWDQPLEPAHCDVVGKTVVWPFKPETMKFAPTPRAVNSRATWPKPGTAFPPLNSCQASLTGSFVGSAVEDGPRQSSPLLFARPATNTPRPLCNNKLASSPPPREVGAVSP